MSDYKSELVRVSKLLSRIRAKVFGIEMELFCFSDKEKGNELGRPYIQVNFQAPDSNTGVMDSFWGRKWYLSPHMLDDEIVKTAWLAYKTAIKHEVLEGFKVDGVSLFGPHVNFESLLKISSDIVKRPAEPEAGQAEPLDELPEEFNVALSPSQPSINVFNSVTETY